MARANRLAQTRFERGIQTLSEGEVIATNGLHAMLLGLQLGRAIFARDVPNGKIANYHRTWLANRSLPVSVHPTLADAHEAACGM